MRLLAQVNIPDSFLGNVGPGTVRNLAGDTPNIFISRILPNIIMFAGVIFFFMILAGGWGVLSGAGKDQSAQDKAKAAAALTYGVIGFIIVISSYFILQIIGTIIGINFLNPPI